NMKKYLTQILAPLYADPHHVIHPSHGPRLSPTDGGLWLLLGARNGCCWYCLLSMHPHPLTDRRMAGDETEGLEAVRGNRAANLHQRGGRSRGIPDNLSRSIYRNL